MSRSLHPPVRILKTLYRGLKGVQSHTIQMVLARPCSLKAASSKTAPTMRRVGRMYVPRTGEGVRNILISGSSSWVRWQSCLLMTSNIVLSHYYYLQHGFWGHDICAGQDQVKKETQHTFLRLCIWGKGSSWNFIYLLAFSEQMNYKIGI